jgi:hypothetical protein
MFLVSNLPRASHQIFHWKYSHICIFCATFAKKWKHYNYLNNIIQ